MNIKYKVAIIGTGWVGTVCHIPAYKALHSKCEIIACTDTRENAVRYAAKRNGIPKYYTDPQKMLEECRPDVVSICTPNAYHRQWSIAALKMGAHVICEKPVCLKYEEVCEIYKVAEECGKVFLPCHNDRFGAREEIRNLVRQERLGEVYFAELSCVRRRGIPRWGAFHMAEESIGGPLCDIGVHFIDSLLFILGNPQFESITGGAWTKIANQEKEANAQIPEIVSGVNTEFIAREYSTQEFNVEDHAAGTIRFAGNLLVNFKFSWALNLPDEDSICLAGTRAGFKFDKYAKNPYRIYECIRGNSVDTIWDLESNYKINGLEHPGHLRVIEHMFNVLEKKETLLITKEEILNLVTILEAFYKSACERTEVRCEEIRK